MAMRQRTSLLILLSSVGMQAAYANPLHSPGSKQAAASIGNLLDKVEVAKANQLSDMKKLEEEAKAV